MQAVRTGTNSRFLNRIFLKSKFKMLVGLCPNPICSASCRCRLRVCSKHFYNKTKRQTRVLLQGRTLVCRRLLGLCFRRCSFCLCDPTTLLDRGADILPSKPQREMQGRVQSFSAQTLILNTSLTPYYKDIGYCGARISTVM